MKKMKKMKKFITLLAIATLLSCQSETSQLSIEEPDEKDIYAECLSIPEASAFNKSLNKDGLINGHIIPDKPKTKAIGVPDKLWNNATINLVLQEDFEFVITEMYPGMDDTFYAGLEKFTSKTGIEIVVYSENEERPEDYVIMQHAFFTSSSIGNQGGRQYGSLTTGDIRKGYKIQHVLGHIAGLEDETSRPDRDEYIDIDYSRVNEGFDFFNINNDATVCGDYNYEALVQVNSLDIDKEETDIVTRKDGTVIPLVTEWSESEIEFLKALYDIN